ncbi:hypothetical protein D8L93_08775 [Sodalis-like symbiont of Bactericera trigonica]|nr:hypothetical protein D8L93_08775 [Sodalis-like symbiont of Bactericera trigonica]
MIERIFKVVLYITIRRLLQHPAGVQYGSGYFLLGDNMAAVGIQRFDLLFQFRQGAFRPLL